MEQADSFTRSGSFLRPSPGVVGRRLDREGVLVHLPTNAIFELNETGIRIWELIVEKRGRDSILEHLTREFDVPVDRAAHELDQLIDRFRREGMLEP